MRFSWAYENECEIVQLIFVVFEYRITNPLEPRLCGTSEFGLISKVPWEEIRDYQLEITSYISLWRQVAWTVFLSCDNSFNRTRTAICSWYCMFFICRKIPLCSSKSGCRPWANGIDSLYPNALPVWSKILSMLANKILVLHLVYLLNHLII